MGRHARSQRFSSGIVSTWFRFGSVHVRTESGSKSVRIVQKTELLVDGFSSESGKSKPGIGNRIMVVVDSSLEAKGALEWTLSHAVRSQDSVILLHILRPSIEVRIEGVKTDGRTNKKAYDLLLSLKNTCQSKRPEVPVEILLVEGKEKGPVIVEEAKRNKASLLVLGQRKRSSFWRLLSRWARKRRRTINGGTVEYCIQYSSCMAIAVRRKSKELGGYLITTKRHKNFWLLA